MTENDNCPCGSLKQYQDCCGKYISGEAAAPTAEALMRSRYSAYVKNQFSYVYDTYYSKTKTHFDLSSIEAQAEHIRWISLEIESTEQGKESDTKGVVTFSASHEINGQIHYLNERSYFEKEDGVWRYVNGETKLSTTAAKSEKVGRNDPCPCGSGKKFKKCCGKP